MANIDTQLNAFKNATYGEDVRDNLMSSLTVVNEALEAAIVKFDNDQEKAAISQKAAAVSEENARRYMELTKSLRDTDGAMIHYGEYTYSDAQGMRSSKALTDGATLRITDKFTTDDSFYEGAGHVYEAGATISYNLQDDKWRGLNQYDIISKIQAKIDEADEKYDAGLTVIKDKINGIIETDIEDNSLDNITAGVQTCYDTGKEDGYDKGYDEGYKVGYKDYYTLAVDELNYFLANESDQAVADQTFMTKVAGELMNTINANILDSTTRSNCETAIESLIDTHDSLHDWVKDNLNNIIISWSDTPSES